jgi:hypothetical protein
MVQFTKLAKEIDNNKVFMLQMAGSVSFCWIESKIFLMETGLVPICYSGIFECTSTPMYLQGIAAATRYIRTYKVHLHPGGTSTPTRHIYTYEIHLHSVHLHLQGTLTLYSFCTFLELLTNTSTNGRKIQCQHQHQ